MLAKALGTYGGKHNKPTGFTFLLGMRSWLRCTENDAAPGRLEQLFGHMVMLYETPDSWYLPREPHVRCVFEAYIIRCKTGKKYDAMGVTMFPSEHCERVLRWVCTKNWLTRNHHASFCGMTLRAISLQEGIDDLDRIERSMALLENFYAGHEIPSYPANWVLTSCSRDFASEEARAKAYQVASSIFIREDIRLNSRSYESMVDIVKKHYRNNGEKDEETKVLLVQELFKRACGAGLLSQGLINKFVEIVKVPEVLQRVFGVDYTYAQMLVQYSRGDFKSIPKPLMIQNLPMEWSVNTEMRPR